MYMVEVQSFDAVKNVAEVLCHLKCCLKLLRLKANAVRVCRYYYKHTFNLLRPPQTLGSILNPKHVYCMVVGSIRPEDPIEQTYITHAFGVLRPQP